MEEDVKKEFTKADLKNGMIVECKDGSRQIFLNGKLAGKNYGNFISFYRDDLKSRNFPSDNIEKIYKSKALSVEKLFDDNYLEIIWERDETKTMTVDEMIKKLEELTGEKIEVEPSQEEMYGTIKMFCQNQRENCNECCLKNRGCQIDTYSTKEHLRRLYNKIIEKKTEEKP